MSNKVQPENGKDDRNDMCNLAVSKLGKDNIIWSIQTEPQSQAPMGWSVKVRNHRVHTYSRPNKTLSLTKKNEYA